jgi:hypothetical protein
MANNRFDIGLEDNDIVIENSDLILCESDDQHIVDTINAAPGWWKESFSDGVGIINYLKGRDVQQDLQRSIKLNLQSDGYKASPVISYDNLGNLKINANVTV